MSFTSSFPILMPFISFSYLIALDKTSNTMLNTSSESGHPYLLPDLRGKLSAFHYWVYIYIFLNKFIYLFIYFWLCWVFVSVRGLSPVAASGDHSSSRCTGLSLSWPLPLQSTGSRRAGSVVVAHGPSRSAACGILPDQGSNPCPPHWQADSQPLRHQGSPEYIFKKQNSTE